MNAIERMRMTLFGPHFERTLDRLRRGIADCGEIWQVLSYLAALEKRIDELERDRADGWRAVQTCED